MGTYYGDTAQIIQLLKQIEANGGGGGGGGAAGDDIESVSLWPYVDGTGDIVAFVGVTRNTNTAANTQIILNPTQSAQLGAIPAGATPMGFSGGGGAAGDDFEVIGPTKFGSTLEATPPTVHVATLVKVRNVTQGTETDLWYDLDGTFLPGGFPFAGTQRELAPYPTIPDPISWAPVLRRVRANKASTPGGSYELGDMLDLYQHFDYPYNNTPSAERLYNPATKAWIDPFTPGDLDDIGQNQTQDVVIIPDGTASRSFPKGLWSYTVKFITGTTATWQVDGGTAVAITPETAPSHTARDDNGLLGFTITKGAGVAIAVTTLQ